MDWQYEEAMESALDNDYRDVMAEPKGWLCRKCNRWHPDIHDACWWCDPPDRK